jgi:hypothetical protein
MENKILFMVIGFVCIYLLYDGLFPPKGQKSYIDKTVELLVSNIKITNNSSEKTSIPKNLWDKFKKFLEENKIDFDEKDVIIEVE